MVCMFTVKILKNVSVLKDDLVAKTYLQKDKKHYSAK